MHKKISIGSRIKTAKGLGTVTSIEGTKLIVRNDATQLSYEGINYGVYERDGKFKAWAGRDAYSNVYGTREAAEAAGLKEAKRMHGERASRGDAASPLGFTGEVAYNARDPQSRMTPFRVGSEAEAKRLVSEARGKGDNRATYHGPVYAGSGRNDTARADTGEPSINRTQYEQNIANGVWQVEYEPDRFGRATVIHNATQKRQTIRVV